MTAPFPTWVYWSALLLKVAAGIALGLIFHYYYQDGDTLTFFEAVRTGAQEHTREPRTEFFLSFLRPLVKVSGNSYWITTIYLSFLSFLGFWYAACTLSQSYNSYRWVIAVSFLWLPSVVFWSSGIIKDSLANAALAVAVSTVIYWHKAKQINWRRLMLLALSVFILFKIKHYLLIAGIFFAGLLVALSLFKNISTKQRLIAILIFLVSLATTQYIHPYLQLHRLPQTLYENNQAILEKSKPDSRIDLAMNKPEWSEIVRAVPKALHIGLFRPSLFDSTPFWGWIHRLENFILAILLVMSAILLPLLRTKIDAPLIIASLGAILLLAILLPISTPNFGTLVRYKSAYLPYLFLLGGILPWQYLASQRKE